MTDEICKTRCYPKKHDGAYECMICRRRFIPLDEILLYGSVEKIEQKNVIPFSPEKLDEPA